MPIRKTIKLPSRYTTRKMMLPPPTSKGFEEIMPTSYRRGSRRAKVLLRSRQHRRRNRVEQGSGKVPALPI
jgi:hypothetical protein